MLIFRGVTTPVAKGIPVTRQEESQVSGFLHDSGKTPLKFKTSPLKSYKKPKKVRMIVLQASIFRGKLAVKKRPVGTWTHTPFASPHRARRRWVERCHMRQVPYLWPKATGRWFKHLGVWGVFRYFGIREPFFRGKKDLLWLFAGGGFIFKVLDMCIWCVFERNYILGMAP